jgi:CHAD domain-containing protein
MLQSDQREKLIELTKSGASISERRRAQILLLYDRGFTTSKIAKEVELSPSRVRYWRRSFEIKGLDIFLSLSVPDGPPDKVEGDPREVSTTNALEESPPEEIEVGMGVSQANNVNSIESVAAMEERASQPDQTSLDSEPPLIAKKQHRPILPEAITIEEFQDLHYFDSHHAHYVRAAATSLFDATLEHHNLPVERRALLAAAATLHEIALDANTKATPKASADMILTHPLKNFSEEDQKIIAALVRHQRGKLKRVTQDPSLFLPLDPSQALPLLALLRIAIALDTSKNQTSRIEEIIPTPQALYIVVKGDVTVEDAVAAQKAGNLWGKLLGQNVRVITEEKAEAISLSQGGIPFPEPMESPGVQPEDTLAEAGRKVLRYHFAEMLHHEQGTKLGEDIEELHDMRVAVRRMRVAFEIFQDAFTAKTIKKHNKGLRAIGRTLGRVRDLDVFMEKADRYLETLPEDKRTGLDPLIKTWQGQRENSRQKMIDLLEGETYLSFLQEFNLFVNTPGLGAQQDIDDYHAPHLVRHVAPAMIYHRLGTVRAYEKILGMARIEQLHELRIEFKRLRYTMEFFREVLGPEGDLIIEEIKVVQDHLGDLNDANVACQILNDFLEGWETRQQDLPLNERENPEPIVAYLASKHAERHHLMVTFGETWAHFDREEFRKNLAAAVAVL